MTKDIVSASWWLKFKRAQRHMIEVRQAVRQYAKRQPYRMARIQEPNDKGNIWRYAITFDPPDPMIIMMLGDFVHNLRSALDHVAVACAQPKYRNSVGFPLAAKDPFALDANYEFVNRDSDARTAYLQAIRGMSFRARAIIAECQPYRRRPESDVFRILGALDNADKHRRTIAIGTGLRAARVSNAIRGVPQSAYALGPLEFYGDGEEVLSFTVVNPQLTDADVDLQCSGITQFSIKVARLDTHKGYLEFPLEMTMLRTLRDIRFTLRQLEKLAIRR